MKPNVYHLNPIKMVLQNKYTMMQDDLHQYSNTQKWFDPDCQQIGSKIDKDIRECDFPTHKMLQKGNILVQ